MMRYFLLLFALTVALVLVIAGQRGRVSRNRPISVFPDMDKQWKLLPQKDAEFFNDDGRSSRQPRELTMWCWSAGWRRSRRGTIRSDWR